MHLGGLVIIEDGAAEDAPALLPRWVLTTTLIKIVSIITLSLIQKKNQSRTIATHTEGREHYRFAWGRRGRGIGLSRSGGNGNNRRLEADDLGFILNLCQSFLPVIFIILGFRFQ